MILIFWGVIMSKLNIVQLVKDVLSSAIGVQSDENRRRAFEQGSWQTYFIAGFVFTALFVGLIILIVNLIL